jgi:hypothetical protein
MWHYRSILFQVVFVSVSWFQGTLAEDVTEAMGAARMNGGVHGSSGGNGHGRQFLNAIDAIAKAVPHTNEAAKRARQDGEAHQHHFGMPSFF